MVKTFTPLKIRSVVLKNRIVVSPMCQYSSEDGFANDWHLVHLGSRAVGGASLVIMEATAVSPEGRITPRDMGLWKDDHIPFLKRICDFISSQGSVPGIQLAHAGRKASSQVPWKGGKPLLPHEGSWQTLGPSAIPFKQEYPLPKEMTRQDIQKLKEDFKLATLRALECGFKVIEIHGAHGYLFHEFLSPLSNHRSDDYGGGIENRCRLLVEITGLVRDLIPRDMPLFVRISATDWIEGGWKIEDSVILSGKLKEVGADLIDCSSGGNVSGVAIPAGPLYQVQFAEQIKKQAGILTAAVGLITSINEVEEILEEQKADLVFMARQLLRDPYFPLHAAAATESPADGPVQYERARSKK